MTAHRKSHRHRSDEDSFLAQKNHSKKNVRVKGVCKRIRGFLYNFPNAKAKAIARTLGLDYSYYKRLLWTECSNFRKWMKAEVQGRLPKPLLSSHRVEWESERPFDMPSLLVVGREAGKRRPRVRNPKPVGEWYVIPNRNRQREYHDEHVTIRIFPKSGTCRVLPGHPMDFRDLKIYVQNALFKTGLDLRRCEEISETLIPVDRHRTFRVGPVTPFKIDFYKESLGISLKADGSHPEHIEVREEWPSWIKPQLAALEKQTEAITDLTEQIKLHLGVMKGIRDVAEEQKKSTKKLTEAIDKFRGVVETSAQGVEQDLSTPAKKKKAFEESDCSSA